MRHIKLGTMLEQPVPRKISADSDGVVPSSEPLEVAMLSPQIQKRRERNSTGEGRGILCIFYYT